MVIISRPPSAAVLLPFVAAASDCCNLINASSFWSDEDFTASDEVTWLVMRISDACS